MTKCIPNSFLKGKGCILKAMIATIVFIGIVITGNESWADSHNKRISCLNAYGEVAIGLCMESISTHPKDSEVILHLADELIKIKRFEKAIILLEQGVKNDPDNDFLHNKLASVRTNYDEQIWFKKKEAGKITPTLAKVSRLDRIRCLKLTGDISLKACDGALAILSDDAELLEGRGDALLSLGRRKEAQQAFKDALSFAGNKERLHQKIITAGGTLETENSKRAQQTVKAIEETQQTIIKSQKEPVFATKIEKDLTLLTRLFDQKLINKNEFDNRKTKLLDTALRNVSQVASVLKDPEPIEKTNINLIQSFKASNPSGKFYALVIGNNDYQFVSKLETAVNDARVIGKLLRDQYGFEVIYLADVKRYEILRAMGKLRRSLKTEDKLLVYYAGHGILDEASSRGYWLPIDAEPDFTANWISTADVTDFLKATDAKHILLIADSCYSGTLLRGGLEPIRGGGDRLKLLNRLEKKKSRTVITSGGLEPVVDGGGDGHSVFARAFITVLMENQTVIEAQSLFEGVRTKVITEADQTPEYSDVRKAGHDGGDFIFVPSISQ